MMNSRTALIMILLSSALMAVCGLADGAEKPNVVISLSQTSPDTAYWRLHAEWLERRPFDGVAMTIDPRDAEWMEQRPFTHETIDPRDAEWYVDKPYWQGKIKWARGRKLDYLAQMYERPREKGSLSWGDGSGLTAGITGPWNPNNKWTDKTIARALADLQATKPKRFKWNLISAGIMSPTTDWFSDEQWSQRCENFAMLARLAREGGCAGILFDDEQYGEGCAWDYEELRRRDAVRGQSFDALRDVARQRGRQFARAICEEHGDLVFWTLHGYSSLAWRLDRGQPQFARSLKPAFFDGMLEGASEGMIFIDGGETSYGYTTRKQFEYGRWLCREAPIQFKLTSVPDLYRRKVRCGFGLWPDFYGDLNPDDPQNSFFSPGRLQRSLHWALKVGDGYVWLYGERWTWWVEGPDDLAPVKMNQKRGFPLAYWQAVSAARCSPGLDASMVDKDRRSSRQVSNLTGKRCRGRTRCFDGDELAPLLARTEKVRAFGANAWTFSLDDRMSFIKGRLAYDAKGFKPISMNAPWKQQDFEATDTTGWYLLDYRVPPELRERDLYLHFPAVRGSLWLIVNGWQTSWRYVEHEPSAWGEPFALQNVSQHILEDGKMTIVLKVQAHDDAGGILAPIQLLAR